MIVCQIPRYVSLNQHINQFIFYRSQIVSFVDRWLYRHMPQVRRWQYDDNSGERSIDLFHVHVFIETAPYTYAPREGMLYVPPHAVLEDQDREGGRDGGAAESAIVL